MTISIALATYNGAQYIAEQLQSFATQDRLPDELIICDDASTDSTVQLLHTFASNAPFPVHIHVNENNIGYARNFERAISLCQGDLIFLSDQDDVWHSNKLLQVERIFLTDSQIGLVINDADIVDMALSSSGKTISNQMKSAGLSTDHMHHGCCMSMQKQLVNILLPIPTNIYSHDSWINAVSTRLTIRYFLSEALQSYRRHPDSTSDSITSSIIPASKLKLFKEKLNIRKIRNDPRNASRIRLQQLQAIYDRILLHEDSLGHFLPTGRATKIALESISRDISDNDARLIIQESTILKRIPSAIKFFAAGRYNKFDSWKSFIRDVII